MIISFITAAHNASATIGETLSSVCGPNMPDGWTLDVIVVDDGSPDGEALRGVVETFAGTRLFRREQNLGKTAAVNFGVPQTLGDVVVILDADDTLVPQWPERLQNILQDWPQDSPLCFSACETVDGQTTVTDPWYSGRLSFDDILNERHMGEYLPIFRGEAIRAGDGYRDAGRGVGCELWTYLTYAQCADLWITSEILRVYNDQMPGSLSSALFTPEGAGRLVKCYDLIFADFEDAYAKHSPHNLGRRRMRQAVFAAMAGERGRAWSLWRSGARFEAPLETLGALILISLGPKAINMLIALAKKLHLVRRYG